MYSKTSFYKNGLFCKSSNLKSKLCSWLSKGLTFVRICITVTSLQKEEKLFFTDVENEVYSKMFFNLLYNFLKTLLGCPFGGTGLPPVSPIAKKEQYFLDLTYGLGIHRNRIVCKILSIRINNMLC